MKSKTFSTFTMAFNATESEYDKKCSGYVEMLDNLDVIELFGKGNHSKIVQYLHKKTRFAPNLGILEKENIWHIHCKKRDKEWDEQNVSPKRIIAYHSHMKISLSHQKKWKKYLLKSTKEQSNYYSILAEVHKKTSIAYKNTAILIRENEHFAKIYGLN